MRGTFHPVWQYLRILPWRHNPAKRKESLGCPQESQPFQLILCLLSAISVSDGPLLCKSGGLAEPTAILHSIIFLRPSNGYSVVTQAAEVEKKAGSINQQGVYSSYSLLLRGIHSQLCQGLTS